MLLITIIFAGCRKPYNPPALSSPGNYLVVEGVINSGADSTFIKLSRTVNISSNAINPETNAMVTVESNRDNIYSLKETLPGRYAAGPLNLDNSLQYQLRVKTANGEEYLSDLVAVKPTPLIDSVGFTIKNDGIEVYANTHDPANNTHYYRWDYSETWQFHSKYASDFEIVYSPKDTIIERPESDQIHFCFASDSSSDIVLGSSADLKQDIIFQNPIVKISSTSEKLEMKYSILLRQYALTGDAYSFWTNLKKNTEQLGGIFDAQPSQINGNIHCISKPAKPVIGYISVTNVQAKRVFIANAQLPLTFVTTYPYDCQEDSTYFFHPGTGINDVQQVFFGAVAGSVEPLSQLTSNAGIIGYFRSDAECADCTIRGTTQQPAFWK